LIIHKNQDGIWRKTKEYLLLSLMDCIEKPLDNKSPIGYDRLKSHCKYSHFLPPGKGQAVRVSYDQAEWVVPAEKRGIPGRVGRTAQK
jgi:hypothetical protein